MTYWGRGKEDVPGHEGDGPTLEESVRDVPWRREIETYLGGEERTYLETRERHERTCDEEEKRTLV